MEKSEDYRSRSVSRPYTYAVGDSAEGGGIKSYRIPKREKQPNDLRKVPGAEIQISEQESFGAGDTMRIQWGRMQRR